MRISCNASPSPDEIRVPALNDCVQGLVGNVGARPGVVWRGRVKKRTSGFSAAAGVPGGSAS